MENLEQNLNEMERQRFEKLANLQKEGKDPFRIEKFNQTHHSMQIKDNFEQYEDKEVIVAGRMMSFRGFGKATFIDVQDEQGKIQCYVKKDEIGQEAYQAFKKLDIGDIIGVKGVVFKTHKDEISIRASEVTLLSKSLRILPEKFHGLKDMDLRYRQRYVDLIMNPEVKKTFVLRTKIVSAIRKYMDSRGYLEVEVPVLDTISGGASARPFITHHNSLDIDMYLRIATELYLKRLIVGGFEKVYEMGRIFRNEGMDYKHNPEFTTIEFYEAYSDLDDMMNMTEDMIKTIATEVLGTCEIEYQGTPIDLSKKFARLDMEEAVKQYSGVDFSTIDTDEQAMAVAKEKGIEIEVGKETRGNVIDAFFEEYVEKQLKQPTFIYGHPVDISPLAKKDPNDPRKTRRFELFINGWEMANAFSELNDPIDQRQRFLAQVEAKKRGDEEAQEMDEDFINAVEVGLPPTGGEGIGIDRLVMLLTNQPTIRDVILFPTMKPLGKKQAGECTDGACKINFAANTQETPAQEEKIDFSNVKVEPLFEESVDFETFSKSDFRAVKVIACEEVPKSNKLLKFTLNDGTDTHRTILSGIKNFYPNPDELVGKTLIAITNLPPRKMMGIESQGMLISAIHEQNGEEGLNLLMVSNKIPAGAKLY